MIGIIVYLLLLFQPEECVVSMGKREAWLSYPGQYPVSIDENVVITLVWYSSNDGHSTYEIWYARWMVGWEGPCILYTEQARSEYPSHPSVAMIEGYDFYALIEGGGNIYLKKVWGYYDTIYKVSDERYSFTPSSVLGTDTTLHIVWQGYKDIVYTSFKDSLFSSIITISQSSYAINPTIASFGDSLAVTWSDLKNGVFDIYIRVFADGWKDEIRVTSSSGSSRFPVITYDNSGVLHIAYMDDKDGGYKIYYTSFDGELGEEILEVSAPGDALYPSITSTPDGNIHLAWADTRNGNYEIYYKKIGDSHIERITYADGCSSYPFLISDVEGGLWLFYQDRRNIYGEIYCANSPPEKESLSQPPVIFPNPSRGEVNISEPVRIYDISGRYVGTYRKSITLSSGVYFVFFRDAVQKLVVIR